MRRIARLYPLHLLTLLIVALLQIVAVLAFGTYLIIGNNDLHHFMLHIFLASFWGFHDGHSFNAPIWSVSVEIISYALFWLLLPWLFRWGIVLPMLIVLAARAVLLLGVGNEGLIFILFCIVYFFLGAGINHFVHSAGRKPVLLHAGALAALAGFLLTGAWLRMDSSIVVPIMITACLLCAASVEILDKGAVAARLRFIGDSTYGVYLWHLPIQITILLVLDGVVGNRNVIESSWFVGFFLALACMAGWLSYRYIERPAGSMILQRLLPAPCTQPGAEPPQPQIAR